MEWRKGSNCIRGLTTGGGGGGSSEGIESTPTPGRQDVSLSGGESSSKIGRLLDELVRGVEANELGSGSPWEPQAPTLSEN